MRVQNSGWCPSFASFSLAPCSPIRTLPWFHMEPFYCLPLKIYSHSSISWIYSLDYKFKVRKRDCVKEHETFHYSSGSTNTSLFFPPLQEVRACLAQKSSIHILGISFYTLKYFPKQDVYPTKWTPANVTFSILLKFPLSEGKKGTISSLYSFYQLLPDRKRRRYGTWIN